MGLMLRTQEQGRWRREEVHQRAEKIAGNIYH
jgi:hypothetical protein